MSSIAGTKDALEEENVLEILKVLTDWEPEYQPDFKRGLPSRYPPVFDCLATYPASVKLVKRLIKLGCEVDAKGLTKLYDTTAPEYATALAWALSQCERGRVVPSAVITALIDAKANVNFLALYSQMTRLILAAKNSRGDIVKKLLEAKADSRSHDHFDKAALFYASQVGDSEAVKALLKTESRLNDGSLHEAARNLHRDCVAALIKAKYDPNFRSSRDEYDGRNALEELAYRCDGSQKVADIKATFWALEKGGADPLEKWRGKTTLFLALSNPQPYHITQAFLNMGKWCERNNPKNVFEELDPETGTRLYSSPTVYLRRTTNKSNMATNTQLERLLKTVGCEDRYFATLGSEQPDCAVGLPDDIAKEVKRRKDEQDKYSGSEIDHQTKMRRHYEEEQAQHELWRAQQSEKTAQNIDQSATIHRNQLHQNMQMSQQRRDALAQKNVLTELSLQSQQQLKLNFQQQTGQQNVLTYQVHQHKIALQENQNRLQKESQRLKVLNAKRMQAIKASEEKERLKAKKAMHKEDISFRGQRKESKYSGLECRS
ncbi:ankyrin repeat-containing domain protein [Camillea tinctor]|nr:ankyrin repeat-containing domain protein [Camillea tinctor]